MRLETLIEENYDKLNENDMSIWNYILRHKEECQTMSIQELAKHCHVSHTTVSRFTHKLGMEGFGELKIFLKWDSRDQESFDAREIERVYQDYIKTLDMMMDRDCSDVLELLSQAGQIYVYGSGAVQKNAARELKKNLLFLDYLCNLIEGREEIKMVLEIVREGDVFFLFSLSGENAFVNELAGRLRAKGVRIISVTKVGNNELSRLSDISLQFYAHPVMKGRYNSDVYMTAQFFVVNEFLLLKGLEYQENEGR